MDLIDRSALIEHLTRRNRFADARRAAGAVIGAKTIEQALMALVLLASAIAIKLREQVGMLLRHQVGLLCFTLKEIRIESQAGRRCRGFRGGAHLVHARCKDQQKNTNYRADEQTHSIFSPEHVDHHCEL
jgi:hypothetical protein